MAGDKKENGAGTPMGKQQLFQHIQIFGRPGHYITRFDNDVDTEQKWRTYNEALLRAVKYLIDSMDERGFQ